MSWMNKYVTRGSQRYYPKNKEKFKNKCGFATSRSSWEYDFMRWCDHNSSVIEWSSESVEVPYIDHGKIDSKGRPKKRRYYPDFFIKIENKQGNIGKYLIEIKPHKETLPPKKGKKKSRATLLKEQRTFNVNKAKWKAADNLCRKMGWTFLVLTEKELFI